MTFEMAVLAIAATLACLGGCPTGAQAEARLTLALEQRSGEETAAQEHRSLLEWLLPIVLEEKANVQVEVATLNVNGTTVDQPSSSNVIDDKKRQWMQNKRDSRYFLIGRCVKQQERWILLWQIIDVGRDRNNRSTWEERPRKIIFVKKNWDEESVEETAKTIVQTVLEREQEIKREPIVHVLCFYTEGVGLDDVSPAKKDELTRLIANLSLALMTRVHVELRRNSDSRYQVSATRVTKVDLVCNQRESASNEDAFARADHVVHGHISVLPSGKIQLVAMIWSRVEKATRELDRWDSDLEDELGLSNLFSQKISQKLIPHLAENP